MYHVTSQKVETGWYFANQYRKDVYEAMQPKRRGADAPIRAPPEVFAWGSAADDLPTKVPCPV